MKTQPFLVLIILFFTCLNGAAEVFHWPQLCDRGELSIKNKSAQTASVWLQKFNKNLNRETEYEISPGQTEVITLESLIKDERYSLLSTDNSRIFEMTYKCGERIFSATSIEGGDVTFKKTNSTENQIWIQNLYTEKNDFTLDYYDQSKRRISRQTLSLAASQALLYTLPTTHSNWSTFKISSTQKYSVFNLSEKGNEKPISVAPQKVLPDNTASYFLVTPRNGSSDSFIVKISDEKIAATARDLIKNPQKEKMLFARIQKNHFGFNRNWSRPEKTFWSWSAAEVTNFADLGSTACNGVPQEVEDRMDFWIVDPGQICFWNYRVKKELTPIEVATGL